jgi:GDP-4-dehydro-6-deoxy-D-mannose reductase
MKLLVTGAGGFVGGHIVEAARARGDECVGTARSADSGGLLELNLFDVAAVAQAMTEVGPDCVIHAAASSAWQRGEVLTGANDELAMGGSLLTAIGRMQAPPALVCIGSAAEYGDLGADPIPEDARPEPISDYGKSKVTLANAFTQACADTNVPLVWARCFNLLGPAQPPSASVANWARQIAAADDGGDVRVGSLDVVRDFIDVRDAARMVLALADQATEAAGVVNVCSGKGVALREALRRMIELSGKQIEIVDDPELTESGSPPAVVGSTKRLEQLLGPSALIPLDQSLTDTLEDWRGR